jgi:tape measure domain-containing protein
MAVDGVKIVLTVDDSQVSLATQRVGSNMRTIQKSLHDTADSTKRIDHHFNGLAGRFRDLIVVGGLLRFALYDIRDVFGGTIGKVIESSAQIEKMTILMKGLSTETNKQAKALDAIKGREFVFNMAKNAPFEVNALTDSFVKLKAAGLDPMDGTMQTLVDSVSRFGGSSETLKRASVAIQQMAGKGVISMEELRQQLGEAVPTAMQNMAVGTGLSMGQLVKHISNGEVEASNALKRMFTVMKFENENAAEELQKSWIGQFAKLKTNMTLFQNSVGTDAGKDGFFGVIKSELEQLNAYFDTSAAKKFSSEVGEALTKTVNMVISGIKFVVKYSEEIINLGKILAVVWAGKTAYKAIEGMIGAIGMYKGALMSTISAERTVQSTRLALDREMVMSASKKNSEILANQIATNNAKIVGLKMQQDAELALMLAHNKRALAAQLSLERGVTTRGTPVNVDKATATMENQRKIAMSYAANAAAFNAAQVSMTQADAVSKAAIIAKSTKAGLALAAMGTAAKGTAVAMGVMKTAFNAVGGWIGLISIALTAGAALWQVWGDKAKQAADKAADSLKAARNGYAEFQDVANMGNAIRINEIEAIKTQNEIDRLKKDKAALPFAEEGRASIAGVTMDTQIKKLEENLAKQRKAISDNGALMSAAISQSNSSIVKSFVDVNQRAAKASMESAESVVRSKLDADTQIVKGSAKSESDKARAITDLEADAIIKIGNLRKKNYENANDQLRKQLDTNTDRFGKTLTENGRKQREALRDSNKELIKAIDGDIANGGVLKTPMTFLKGDPTTKGAGDSKDITSKIQDFIDALKVKNAGLKSEIETSNKNLSELAKFEQKLANGDFDERVKVGKGKYKTVKPAGDMANAARDALAAVKESQDAIDYTNKVAKDLDSAFSALESAWMDGNAKYEAALANYDANGNADNKVNQKLVATLDESRAAYSRYFDSIALGAEEKAAAMAQLEIYIKRATEAPQEAKALETSQAWKKNLDALKIAAISNASERAQAERAITMKQLEDQFQMRYAALDKESAVAKQFAEDYKAFKLALDADLARKAETPIQKMGRDWRDVTTQMQNASTGWANKTIDAFMELATTGKASFTGLVESILTDILRIGMQKQMSKMLEGVFGAIEGVAGRAFGDGSDQSAGGVSLFDQAIAMASRGLNSLVGMFTGAKASTGELTEGLAETAVGTITQAGKSATASGALTYVASTANAAAAALSKLAVSAGGASVSSGGGAGMFGGILDSIGGMFGGGDVAPSESYGGILGMEGVSTGFDWGSLWPFANGGVMSELGSLELRKYANGGIANSPQMAMFGEGSMNEAYVPLPDGRSIPVTMTGGGGNSNVTVNVINAPAGTETRETQNSDGSTNIDVIIAQVEGKISQNVSRGRGSLSGVMEKTYGLNRAMGSYG